MNKNLRQLFTAVLALFLILGISTTLITAVRATALNADPRNVRSLYNRLSVPRGAILASDGTVMAKSEPSNDAFSYQRTYTAGPEYAPVTGYFSINQPADRGIEASRAELLSGQSDDLFWQRFKALVTGAENKGASIETSIIPALQTLAYQLLEGYDGAVVAIEPKTGRVLAMVSTPSYDPNVLAVHSSSEANDAYAQLTSDAANPMLNRAISELYPPGSTFKTVVAAAALESGKYTGDSQIPAGAQYTLPGTSTVLTNVSSRAAGVNGKISLSDGLTYSSNTAYAQLGIALGEGTISEQATKLGFSTPITLDGSTSTGTPTNAVASSFPTGQSDDRIALASIGQGDTKETPLQNALTACAIANDGVLMRPTIVDKVRSSDLTVLSQTTPSVMSQAFSADTANALTGMMEKVITDVNPSLSVSGVSVAAKTGTAQIGEDNSSLNSWVMGFAPADDPKIAVSVVLHNVNVAGSAGAGPIMKQVIEEALKQ